MTREILEYKRAGVLKVVNKLLSHQDINIDRDVITQMLARVAKEASLSAEQAAIVLSFEQEKVETFSHAKCMYVFGYLSGILIQTWEKQLEE